MTYDAKTEYLKQNGVTNIFEVADDKLNPASSPLIARNWDASTSGLPTPAGQIGGRSGRRQRHQAGVHDREDESYLACSPRTAAATIKALTSALASIKKDGTYKKIVDRYDNK